MEKNFTQELRLADPELFCANYARRVGIDRLPRLAPVGTPGALYFRGNYYMAWDPKYPYIQVRKDGLLVCSKDSQDKEELDQLHERAIFLFENWRQLRELNPIFNDCGLLKDRLPKQIESEIEGALFFQGNYYVAWDPDYPHIGISSNGIPQCTRGARRAVLTRLGMRFVIDQ